MGALEKFEAFGKRFKLDSHHAIERFGVIFGVLGLSGAVVLSATGVSAFVNTQATLSDKALYTNSFTTSKSRLAGSVSEVYSNELGNKALIVMEFAESAQISYNASDYQAFLLGAGTDMSTEKVKTRG